MINEVGGAYRRGQGHPKCSSATDPYLVIQNKDGDYFGVECQQCSRFWTFLIKNAE